MPTAMGTKYTLERVTYSRQRVRGLVQAKHNKSEMPRAAASSSTSSMKKSAIKCMQLDSKSYTVQLRFEISLSSQSKVCPMHEKFLLTGRSQAWTTRHARLTLAVGIFAPAPCATSGATAIAANRRSAHFLHSACVTRVYEVVCDFGVRKNFWKFWTLPFRTPVTSLTPTSVLHLSS